MPARPLTRRSRLLAAATLIAATGATVLAPATAFAAAPPAAVAPAADVPATDAPAADTPTTKADQNAAKPLAATLETAPGQAPITRGGEGATMRLTVTNSSDQEQQYHPTLSVAPTGSAPSGWNWIEFSAKEVSAPVSYGVSGFGNNGFVGYVLPNNAMSFVSFKVPAGATYTWDVTVKVRASLPADNTSLKVTLQNDKDNSTNSAPVALAVSSPAPALFQRFTSAENRVSFAKPFETDLLLANNGAGITAPITPTLRFPVNGAVLKLDAQQPDGTWVAVPGSNNTWQLPAVAGGLGKGESHHYKLRLSLVGTTGPGTFFSEWLSLLPDTDQGPVDIIVRELVEVNGYRATPDPEPTPSTPTTAPADTPKPTASDTPAAAATTAPAPAVTQAAVPAAVPTTTPSAATGAKVVTAGYTSGNQAATTTTTTTATGTTGATGTTLASTGAGESGALFGTAGALVLLGAGSVFYARRRRAQD
ncbi:LPXTG cell wall anchor domain-containing protein [Kitasatospora sp. NPDC094019]|uniref:LPXTG cell wall anchor domain-containing protein n=1 Tax=Kitasatospora sp. NPDC094019 TaxID=3364091 RepID=UPI00381C8823